MKKELSLQNIPLVDEGRPATALDLQNAALAVKADNNKPPAGMVLSGFPPHIAHLWNFREGKLERHISPPHPREYEAATVESLAKLINEFVGNDELHPRIPEGATSATLRNPLVFVWIHHGRVIVTLDETGERRERLGLELVQSEPFRALTALAGNWVGQREFVEALRVHVNGVYSPETVIDTIRSLRWSQNEEGDSTVQTGRARFGRRVEAAIAGVADKDLREIEDLTVTIPVYSNLFDEGPGWAPSPILSTFRCAVDVHPTEQKIILKLKAGELDRHLRDLDRKVHDMLVADITHDRVRIFFGDPDGIDE